MLAICSIFPAPIRFIKYIKRPRNAFGFTDVIFIASINPRTFVGLLTYIILLLHSQLICIDYSVFPEPGNFSFTLLYSNPCLQYKLQIFRNVIHVIQCEIQGCHSGADEYSSVFDILHCNDEEHVTSVPQKHNGPNFFLDCSTQSTGTLL